MKLGIIRCKKQQGVCFFFGCLDAIKNKTAAFEGTNEEIEIAGINDCGGCPGEKALERVIGMVRMGQADAIATTSCATKRDCEHSKNYVEKIKEKLSQGVAVVDRNEFRKKMRELPPSEGKSQEEIAAERDKLEKESENGIIARLGENLLFFDYTH